MLALASVVADVFQTGYDATALINDVTVMSLLTEGIPGPGIAKSDLLIVGVVVAAVFGLAFHIRLLRARRRGEDTVADLPVDDSSVSPPGRSLTPQSGGWTDVADASLFRAGFALLFVFGFVLIVVALVG